MENEADTHAPHSASDISPLRCCAYGLCMGTADAVPGVSGGTIALILGFYDQFIDALARLIAVVSHPRSRDHWQAAWQGMKFLIPLGIGMITALVIATKLLVGRMTHDHNTLEAMTSDELRQFFTEHPPAGLLLHPQTAPYVFAVFFGLVLFSIPQPWKMIRQHIALDWVYAAVAAMVVASISLCTPANLGTHPLFFVGAGMLAISVMLLPGISGSLVLLIIGMYQPVSQALSGLLSDLSHGHSAGIISNGSTVAYFLCGIVLGVMSFVPLLKLLLKRHHDRSMAILTGLMCGSLVALWPWKTHYMPKFIDQLGPMLPQLPPTYMSVIYALCSISIGILGIYALGRLAQRSASGR